MNSRSVTQRTVTQGVETDTDPETVFALLADPRNLPRWAPLFADEVTGDPQQGWLVRKDGQTFALKVAGSAASGTVDYLREIAPGRVFGAYMRVFPRPGSGGTIVMTLPIAPGTTQDEVAAILNDELTQLVRLSSEKSGVKSAENL